jgi:hypothetical protein
MAYKRTHACHVGSDTVYKTLFFAEMKLLIFALVLVAVVQG